MRSAAGNVTFHTLIITSVDTVCMGLYCSVNYRQDGLLQYDKSYVVNSLQHISIQSRRLPFRPPARVYELLTLTSRPVWLFVKLQLLYCLYFINIVYYAIWQHTQNMHPIDRT